MITYRKKIHENEWNAITKTLPLPCAETPAFKRDIESFIYSEVSNFVPKVFPVKLHWIYQCFYWTVKKLNMIFLAWKRNNDPYKVLSGGAVATWLALEMPDRAVRARAQPVASSYWNQRQGSYADIYHFTAGWSVLEKKRAPGLTLCTARERRPRSVSKNTFPDMDD